MVSAWMEKGNARAYVQDKAIDPRPLVSCRDSKADSDYMLHRSMESPAGCIICITTNQVQYFMAISKAYAQLHFRRWLLSDAIVLQVNVLISDNGQALLTDFGFSHMVNSSFSMTVSSHGGGKGTLKWKSPELLQGGVVSAKADVWAFGMTALVRLSLFHAYYVKGKQELFTREDPFHGFPTFAAAMFRIIMGRPDRPSANDTCDRMTDDWWNICSRCWQNSPASRPTMLDIVETITKIVRSLLVVMFPSPTYLYR